MERLVSIIDNISDNSDIVFLKSLVDEKLSEIKDKEIDKLISEGKAIMEKHNLPSDYFISYFSGKKKSIKCNQLDLLAHVQQANERAKVIRDKKNK